MDFGFSEEQELLRRTAREVLGGCCPAGWVRAALDGGGEAPEQVWHEATRLGWLGIAVAEADGGAGGTFVDQVVVLEEMGRVLAPAAYVASTCGAVPTITALSDGDHRRRLLAPLLSGERRAALVAGDHRTPWDRTGVAVQATGNGDGAILTGTVSTVLGANGADLFVVAAGQSDGRVGVWLVDVDLPGTRIVTLHAFDPSRQLAHVTLDEVEVGAERRLGDPDGDAWPAVVAALDRLAVATCAELCGAGDRMLEMTVTYAKGREQFDRPIGSFQAVKHLCADMLVRLEASKAAVYYAALCLDEGRPDAAFAASVAKAYAGENIPLLAEDAVQVHGGIGFTWEHDVHLFVRRAKTSEQLLGSTQGHRERVAQLAGV